MGTQKYSIPYIMFLSLLAALGSVLMLVEIPYPFVPFLTFDLSEMVILFVVVAFGLKPAILVAAIKTLLHLLIKGPVGPLGIGQITALVASITIALAYYFLVNKFSKEDKDNEIYPVIYRNILTGLIFAAVMVTANYLFITPIYLGGLTYLDVQSWVTPETFFLNINTGRIDPYLFTILIVYIPFNLMKVSMVLAIFAAVKDYLLKAFNTYYKG